MEIETYLRFVVALVFVIALIGLLAFLVKRYGLGGRMIRPAGGRRLSVVEISPLDGKRRLVLIRRDDTEHLLIVGANGELVVESGIPAPPAAGAHKGNAAGKPSADDGARRAAAPSAAGAGDRR